MSNGTPARLVGGGDTATRRLGESGAIGEGNRPPGEFGLAIGPWNGTDDVHEIDTPFQRVGGLPGSHGLGNEDHRND